MVDVKVRSPTGRAWLTFVIGFIVAGELLFEVRKDEPAKFFNIPFTDGELIGWMVLLWVVSAVGLVWLLFLYLRPGRLVLDPDAGVIRRLQYRLLRSNEIAAPASEWSIRIGYFSAEHHQRGVFKRLELVGPDFEEVLLFTDFREGEALAKALEAMAEQLGDFRIDVERAEEP